MSLQEMVARELARLADQPCPPAPADPDIPALEATIRAGAGAEVTLGIGIITYNRRDVLLGTIERVLRHTRAPFRLVIADDGSTDGTMEALKGNGIRVITGANSGVAWNKNRALYWLAAISMCDPIILLEDDTRPTMDGWEATWIEAAQKWGHTNLAGDWFSDAFLGGAGTVASPVVSRRVSGQCSAFGAVALATVGYFDTRFQGYGHEHVEHSFRMARAGYGGVMNEQGHVLHALLRGGIEVLQGPSSGSGDEAARNLDLCRQIMGGPIYRPAWRDEAEFHRLRSELEACHG